MRRLEGVSFMGGGGPVYQGYLSLGDVTVLSGPNDSGKTRLLRLIEVALNTPAKAEYVDILGLVSDEEADRLIDDDAPLNEDTADVSFTVWNNSELLQIRDDDEHARVAVRLDSGLFTAWRYGRPLEQLGEVLSEQIATDVAPYSYSEDIAEPVKLEYLGVPDPRLLPLAVLLPTAWTTLRSELADALLALSLALQNLALQWQHLDGQCGPLAPLQYSFIQGEPDPPLRNGKPSWAWLLDEDDTQQTEFAHPATQAACAAIDTILAGLLPEFIASDYRLDVRLARPSEIAAGHPLRLWFLRRDTLPQDDPLDEDWAIRAPAEQAPGGFQLWLQLCASETATRIRAITSLLADQTTVLAEILDRRTDLDGIGRWDYADNDDPDHDEEDEDEEDTEPPEAPEPVELDPFIQASVMEIKDTLQETLALLTHPTPSRADRGPSREERSERGAEVAHGELAGLLLEAPRERIYLIDEPEQHLHPALHHRAARWLAQTMDRWDTQCVITTHALAFIDMPGQTHAYQISRASEDPDHPDIATLTAHDPVDLSPYSELARAIGLDHGELLARTRAFLLADPRTTAVVQTLCGDDLTRAGVNLIALHGTPPNLAEITLLTQVTTAPIILLFAGLHPDDIVGMQRADAGFRSERADAPGEAGTLARAVELALRSEDDFHIFTLNVADLIELIDVKAIRAGQRGATDPYPGHGKARIRYEVVKHVRAQMTYAAFLKETYGVSVDQFVTGLRSRSDAPTTAPLVNLLWRLDELLLSRGR